MGKNTKHKKTFNNLFIIELLYFICISKLVLHNHKNPLSKSFGVKNTLKSLGNVHDYTQTISWTQVHSVKWMP